MNLATKCRVVRDFLYFKFKDIILLEAYMCMLVCSRIVDAEVDAIECFKLERIVPYARNGICLHPRQGSLTPEFLERLFPRHTTLSLYKDESMGHFSRIKKCSNISNKLASMSLVRYIFALGSFVLMFRCLPFLSDNDGKRLESRETSRDGNHSARRNSCSWNQL